MNAYLITMLILYTLNLFPICNRMQGSYPQAAKPISAEQDRISLVIVIALLTWTIVLLQGQP